MAIAWVDGGCRGNNDKDAVRFAYGSYKILLDHEVVARKFDLSSARTSNEAEYLSLIQLLQDPALPDAATILTDSGLLVGHLEKGWRVKADNLKQLHQQARKLLRRKRALLVQVPRDEIVAQLGH